MNFILRVFVSPWLPAGSCAIVECFYNRRCRSFVSSKWQKS